MRENEISVEESLKVENALFLDVRDYNERELAHIPSSLHIPLPKLKYENTKTLKHEHTIIVYCASGCRSAAAAEILIKAGHKNVYSLKGGINAWQKAGYDVVAGGALSKSELSRYARQLTLPEIGVEGQKKIAAARVLIVGAGGLGSPAAFYLAAAGVGTIGIIDSDSVELDNLHRQILHTTKSVGEKKVKSAAAAIAELNDKVATKLYDERLTAKNAGKIFKDYDLVLDGSDNFETRYVVNEACVKSGIPLVHGSILRYTGQLSVFDPKNGGPCYSCVYPEPPPAEVAPSCAEAGVLGVIPGIIGTMQGLEALKIIAGFGEKIIGKLLIFDGLTCRMKMLGVKRDVGCKVCSGDGKMVR